MKPIDRLDKLATDLETQAQAIRTTIKVLQLHDSHALAQALPAKLAAATQLRTGGPGQRASRQDAITAIVRTLWATGAPVQVTDVRTRLQADHQLAISASGLVHFVRRQLHGRKKGEGAAARWLPPRGWTPDATLPAAAARNVDQAVQSLASSNGHGRPQNLSKAAQRRQRMADTLREFSGQPVPVENAKRLAPLIRRGYLKKKQQGYVATAKAARWLDQTPA